MKKIITILCLSIVCLTGCTNKTAVEAAPTLEPLNPNLSVAWLPLIQRLKNDGIYEADLEPLFIALGPVPSPDPMGRKIKELYTRAFIKPPQTPPKLGPDGKPLPRPTKPRVYPGFVTPENAQKCRDFLKAHAPAFASAQQKYGVPKEIAVALMFVETKLGTYMGKESAFLTLASMSASTQPQDILIYLEKLPNYQEQLPWINEKMSQRSDWAYKELLALIANFRSAKYDPLALPGSIYGAVGLCQFMPSNIEPYGADGDGDGSVNLFTVPDAVASLSNYLVKHGWKNNPDRKKQHNALKTYNKVDIYANTILALADAVKIKPAQPKN